MGADLKGATKKKTKFPEKKSLVQAARHEQKKLFFLLQLNMKKKFT